MSELKCPKCGSKFKIDESDYAIILQQVRNDEFERELNVRKIELEQYKKAEIEKSLSEKQQEYEETVKKYEEKLKEKDKEIEL